MSDSVCGTSRIAGFRFSIYPMSDRFAEIIMAALKETDTSNVWMKTDDISTCIRGRIEHVFDVAKAMYMHAAKTGLHVVMNGTFSIGCPGDSEGDAYMEVTGDPANEQKLDGLHVEAPVQFALYPLNSSSYMSIIADVCELAKKRGVFAGGVHYASRLDGDAHEVFAALEEAFRHAQERASHVTMTVNLSANSPSRS